MTTVGQLTPWGWGTGLFTAYYQGAEPLTLGSSAVA